MVQDPNPGTRDTGATHRQAVGETKEGPLGHSKARREVQDKRRAADVGGADLLVLVLE